MKLYDYPDCPFAQKVRVVLAEKELEYETVFVDLRTGEHRQNAEFLKLNPYGKVPILIDDEVVVYDSTIINEYLEDEYPIPSLMPEDSAAKARVRTLEDYCDNSFLPSAGFVQAELSKPVEEQDQERLSRYRTELQRGLKRLEVFLGGKEYLVGDFSLADVAFVPALLILPRLGVDVDPALRGVTAWINRLKQRPSVQSLER
ncbi:MAG: glutathione S-transferase family protein [Candidatus Binatia bacterium]